MQYLHGWSHPLSVIGAWNKEHGEKSKTSRYGGGGRRAAVQHPGNIKKVLLPPKGGGRGARGWYSISK